MSDDWILYNFALEFTGDLNRDRKDFIDDKRLKIHERLLSRLVLSYVNENNVYQLVNAVIHNNQTSGLTEIVKCRGNAHHL